MLIHVVLIKFKKETTDEEIEILEQALNTLPQRIAEIKGYEFGRDILRTERSYDFALVARFDDTEALKRYQNHPDHIPVLMKVLEMAEAVIAVDFVQ
ncbi:MAG: Dabb family protein [Syntrophales bacterium]|nr:Dabb family protein [Syntrophales bacterium]